MPSRPFTFSTAGRPCLPPTARVYSARPTSGGDSTVRVWRPPFLTARENARILTVRTYSPLNCSSAPYRIAEDGDDFWSTRRVSVDSRLARFHVRHTPDSVFDTRTLISPRMCRIACANDTAGDHAVPIFESDADKPWRPINKTTPVVCYNDHRERIAARKTAVVSRAAAELENVRKLPGPETDSSLPPPSSSVPNSFRVRADVSVVAENTPALRWSRPIDAY